MADVCLTQRAENGITNRVHQYVGVGMSIESLRIGDLHSAEDQFSTFHQLVNVIANADMIHEPEV